MLSHQQTVILAVLNVAVVVFGFPVAAPGGLSITLGDPATGSPVYVPGQDAGPALQAAIESIARKGKGQGLITIPPGEHRILTPVVVSDASLRLTLQGPREGARVVLRCDNYQGVVLFRNLTPDSQINVRDLTFRAGRPGAGVAVEFSRKNRSGEYVIYMRPNRLVLLENLRVEGTAAGDHFTTGILLAGPCWPLLENVEVCGVPGTNWRDDSPVFAMATGVSLDMCYAPDLKDCSFRSAHTAVRMHGTSQEAFRLIGCRIEGCRVGLDLRTTSQEPVLIVEGCEIRCRDVGLRIFNRRHANVTGNVFAALSLDHPYTDVLMESSWSCIVNGNRFQRPSPAPRRNIVLRRCNDILVASNAWSGSEKTVVQIEKGANAQIRLEDNSE